MTLSYVPGVFSERDDKAILVEELDYALSHCRDIPALQMSSLTQLPSVLEQSLEESGGFERGKALHKELIACAEQVTQRPVYPIEAIVAAIENGQLGTASQYLARVKRDIDIPFSRNKVDLARYYAIRLVMEGLEHNKIARFLEVDPRTVAGYIAQARERIKLVLESQSVLFRALVTQGIS